MAAIAERSSIQTPAALPMWASILQNGAEQALQEMVARIKDVSKIILLTRIMTHANSAPTISGNTTFHLQQYDERSEITFSILEPQSLPELTSLVHDNFYEAVVARTILLEQNPQRCKMQFTLIVASPSGYSSRTWERSYCDRQHGPDLLPEIRAELVKSAFAVRSEAAPTSSPASSPAPSASPSQDPIDKLLEEMYLDEHELRQLQQRRQTTAKSESDAKVPAPASSSASHADKA